MADSINVHGSIFVQTGYIQYISLVFLYSIPVVLDISICIRMDWLHAMHV